MGRGEGRPLRLGTLVRSSPPIGCEVRNSSVNGARGSTGSQAWKCDRSCRLVRRGVAMEPRARGVLAVLLLLAAQVGRRRRGSGEGRL